MDDERIIGLYQNREESAIRETKAKYGRYCRAIAYNILQNEEDAEECENDTYLDVWNSIPPQKPSVFSAYLGAITRRISLDRFRKKTAEKRGGGTVVISLTELEDCIPSGREIDETLDTKLLASSISSFLRTLPEAESNIFIRRYYHFDSIYHLSETYGFTQSKVKMMLKRTREKLLRHLKKEGFYI